MFRKVCFQSPFEFLIMFDLLGKMLVKILMCHCYKDYFKDEGHPFLKHIIHFHCKCEDKDHMDPCPWGTTILNMDDNEGVLQKNVSVKKSMLILLANIVKFCVEKQYFKEHLSNLGTILLDDYLKEIVILFFILKIIGLREVWTIQMSLKYLLQLTVDLFYLDLKKKWQKKS